MKNTLIILLSFLSISLLSNAQNELGDWKLGVNFSYDHEFNSLSEFDQPYIEGIDYYHPFEPASPLNYTAGITAQYAIHSRFELGSGLAVSKKKSNWSNIIYYGCFGDYSYQHITPQYSGNLFLEVPLFIRYNILNRKLGIHVESGMTTSYAIRPSYYQNRYLLSASGGLGINYDFGKIINLSLTANYERKLTSFNRLSSINFPNSLSLEIKALYKFKTR